MIGLEKFLGLVPGKWAACWISNSSKGSGSFFLMDDAIAWGGISLCPGAGGPARYLQLHLHQEDSVMVGEDLVYSLTVTPFINSVSCLLCQPPFWGCQSRPKLVPQEAEAAKARGLARTIGAGASNILAG